jgi:hypothetical protein
MICPSISLTGAFCRVAVGVGDRGLRREEKERGGRVVEVI